MTMSNIVITADHVGKVYDLDQGNKYYDLRDLIIDAPKRALDLVKHGRVKQNQFWALDDVSFSVRKGEVLGVIGRNGAGKSTLLKIFSRIVLPSTGKIVINGRMSSILGVGTGFNNEFTGRENVFLSGAILGMKKQEIVAKYKKIVDFSEVGKFIDMPVKKYSSGMSVRLAFAIAVHLDPEILIIDEVLAVGDVSFQRKSLRKMYSLAKDDGRTVLFVSHNMATIESLCDRAILLKEGRLIAEGNTRKIIARYLTENASREDGVDLGTLKTRTGSGDIRITHFWIEDERGKKIKSIRTGSKCRFVFKYRSSGGRSYRNVDVGFGINSATEQPLFIHYMSFTNQILDNCPPKGKFVFEFDKFPLVKDQYKMSFRVVIDGTTSDFVIDAITIDVDGGDFYRTGIILDQTHSPFYVDGHWRLAKI